MSNAIFKVPPAINEPIKSYKPGSAEREELIKSLDRCYEEVKDIPMHIGGKSVRTKKTVTISPPHDHKHIIGKFHKGDTTHVKKAIEAALGVKEAWSSLPWEQRASVFL